MFDWFVLAVCWCCLMWLFGLFIALLLLEWLIEFGYGVALYVAWLIIVLALSFVWVLFVFEIALLVVLFCCVAIWFRCVGLVLFDFAVLVMLFVLDFCISLKFYLFASWIFLGCCFDFVIWLGVGCA